MNDHEQDLLNLLNAAAVDSGYSAEALVAMAIAVAKWKKTAVVPNLGPYPQEIDEWEFTSESLASWPEWVARLVPPGSKWERLHWPDDSVTIRLVNQHSLVLAAKHFVKQDLVEE